jgi:sialidase-1
MSSLNLKINISILTFLITSLVTINATNASDNQIVDVYQQGEAGIAAYRIPALIQTKKGTLLAFAEARKGGLSDTGDISIVVKRSKDNGRTWTDLTTVWSDAGNTCGNPVPIVDRKTGRIFLIGTWNNGKDHENDLIRHTAIDTRRIFLLHSDDDGRTWSAPREITRDTKQNDWGWVATGPGHGIQLENGPHRNRLVVPANHTTATGASYSHIIYSDDNGQTWNLGGTVPQAGENEATVAELPDGKLLLNMRNYNRENSKCRAMSSSDDGGQTWSGVQYPQDLLEPVCQGSMLNYMPKGKITSTLLFSNPASMDERKNSTLKLSTDQGKTWSQILLVHKGFGAYSDLVNLGNGNIGILFEYGTSHPYEKIGFSAIRMQGIL